jgi:hypothetical protein
MPSLSEAFDAAVADPDFHGAIDPPARIAGRGRGSHGMVSPDYGSYPASK